MAITNLKPGGSFALIGLAAGTLTLHYIFNHIRIRSYKRRHPHAIVVPATNYNEKKLSVVFIPGTGQNSNSCRGRMEILAAKGYECHALNLTHTGHYTTSYEAQMKVIDRYVSTLNKSFVLLGHSQGGLKAQLFSLSETKHKPRAIILLGTCDLDLQTYLHDATMIVFKRRPVSALVSIFIGSFLFIDPTAMLYGPGPLRYFLNIYREMFNPSTLMTTLSGERLTVREFAKQSIDDHDPFITDIYYDHVALIDRIPTEKENGLKVLHLIPEDDILVPISASERVVEQWGVDGVVIPGQAHQMGDPGWETSVMEPIISFLKSLD